jgi:hypothetical protein
LLGTNLAQKFALPTRAQFAADHAVFLWGLRLAFKSVLQQVVVGIGHALARRKPNQIFNYVFDVDGSRFGGYRLNPTHNLDGGTLSFSFQRSIQRYDLTHARDFSIARPYCTGTSSVPYPAALSSACTGCAACSK